MDTKMYAEVYPITLPESEIHRGPHAPYIREAQDYSYQWGRLLHTLLGSEVEGDLLDEQGIKGYYNWFQGGYQHMVSGLMDQPRPVAARGLNEINFHHLNERMLGMWHPVQGYKWRSDAERSLVISRAQHNLALDGLLHYSQREHFVKENGGPHALFEPDMRVLHDAYTGMVQEYDAAIVLLDVMRTHKNLSIVPAPLQFERSKTKAYNVDFVAIDTERKRALGVQVKSRVRQDVFDAADAERVVFLDGDIDMGNVKLVRTKKISSAERLISWPGIIATKRVNSIKSYGQPNVYYADNRVLPRLKMMARHLVGNIKVDSRELSQRIGERIMQKI